MIYGYKCNNCKRQTDSVVRADTLGPCGMERCGGELRRDFSGVGFGKVQVQEHWNKSTNSVIRTDKQFDEQMKVASASASMRTGMDHRFERVDPTDKKSLGVTDEGMESTNRQRHKMGLRPVT